MGLRREIKNRLSKMNGRLRREGRRFASVVLCGVMVAGNLSAVPVSALADSDSDNEFTYEIERAALQEALQTAISEGDTVNEDLNFAGEYAEEYEQLLEADGTLYELEPAIADDNEDRDKALSLRVFARIEGDIPVDSMYEIDGAEEIVFLVSNKTEETVTASIYVDGLETEAITILPADSIPVENESSVVGNTAVTSGTITGGPSGGGSGNGGSGGSAASTSLEIEETEKVTDEVVIEITDTAANDEMSADSAIEDSSVSIVDENDSDSGTQTDENGVTDDEPIENEQTPDDEETADPDTDDRDADAADVNTEDGEEAADDTVNRNTKNGEADAANKESKSEDNTNGDIASNTTDTENTDTSGEADTTSGSNTDTTEHKDGESKEGTAGNKGNFDITEDSDVSVFGSAISVHSSILLATGKATTSDADETASNSDASNAVEGITYESVQLDRKGTAAFATTAADLKLDEVVLVEYMAQENDVTVTVIAAAGALPSGAQLSASMYEEDSEEYAAAGKSVGYDAEDENTGMAAIDITFYDKGGEEVEPLAPVTVSIDVSEIIPENADASTIEVQHLAETEEGVEPVLMADVTEDTEGSIDEANSVVEFVVESFSTFVIIWQKNDVMNIKADSLIYKGKDYIVAATYGTDAKLPEGAQLLVKEYAKDSENYLSRYAETAELYGWDEKDDYTKDFRLFNIGFYINGKEIEPAADVQVTISYLNQESKVESYAVTHYGDEGTEIIEAETSYADGTQITKFASSSFSEFSLTANNNRNPPSTIYVWYDHVTVGDGNRLSAQNDSTGISSVTLDGSTVPHGNGGNGNNQNGLAISNPYSTSGKEVSITVTPAAGYYITFISVNCCGSGAATSCTTYADGGAYTSSFTVSSAGAITVKVPLDAEKGFHHDSQSANYFILIGVAPIPSPLYVEYDYGDIVKHITESTYTTDTTDSSAFSEANGWTSTSSGNDYGDGYGDDNDDGGPGVKTDATQYKYAYSGEDNASAAASWKHYANAITEDAKKQAAGAGYIFAGWKAEYYTSVTVEKQTAIKGGYQDAYNNWDYTFTTSYGDATYNESDEVTLTTNVRLIAQWIPIGIAVTKTVSGLSDTSYSNQPLIYTLQLQKQNTADEWDNCGSAFTISVTGDGSENTIIYPLPTGTYRVVELNKTDLTAGDYIYYLTVNEEGTITVSSSLTEDTDYTSTAKGEDTVALIKEGLEIVNTYSPTPATVNFTILKVDKSDDDTGLFGAEFTLTTTSTVEGTTTTTYYTSNGESTTGYTEITTNGNGAISITGLRNGSYYLTEVTAPDGYNLLSTPVKLTVANGSVTANYNGSDENTATVKTDDSDGSITITVTNTAGSKLPLTGGPGTTPFRIAGLLLTSCSAYLIYKTLRRRGGWLGE